MDGAGGSTGSRKRTVYEWLQLEEDDVESDPKSKDAASESVRHRAPRELSLASGDFPAGCQ